MFSTPVQNSYIIFSTTSISVTCRNGGNISVNSIVVAFENVKAFVRQIVLIQQRCLTMAKIREVYKKELEQLSVKGHTSCNEKLKERLINHFGKRIKFVQVAATKPEVIFSSNADTTKIAQLLKDIEETDESTEESAEENDDDSAANINNVDQHQTIYHSGVIVNRIIKAIQSNMPWPPSPEDITMENIKVPDLLYNLIGYIITGTTTPVDEGKLAVNPDIDRIILSVAQDTYSKKGLYCHTKELGFGCSCSQSDWK